MKAKIVKFHEVYDIGYTYHGITVGMTYDIIKENKECFCVLDNNGLERYVNKDCFEIVNEQAKQSSDGGSTSYYKFPEGATELFDLINHRNMNFAVGNIFKACYRMGEKEGIDDIYDLKKIIFMAEQELKRLGHKPD